MVWTIRDCHTPPFAASSLSRKADSLIMGIKGRSALFSYVLIFNKHTQHSYTKPPNKLSLPTQVSHTLALHIRYPRAQHSFISYSHTRFKNTSISPQYSRKAFARSPCTHSFHTQHRTLHRSSVLSQQTQIKCQQLGLRLGLSNIMGPYVLCIQQPAS